MATKWTNKKNFMANVNGHQYCFYAHTTKTRNGFCHTVMTAAENGWLTDTKVSWINRTWERFDYATVLARAITKCPKDDQAGLYAAIIDKTQEDERVKCEAMLGSFQKALGALKDSRKEQIRNAAGTITSIEQAEAVTAVAKFASLMG